MSKVFKYKDGQLSIENRKNKQILQKENVHMKYVISDRNQDFFVNY